jgi:hypothetical protein
MKPCSLPLIVAMAALGAVAGCGGRSPIEPGDGGSNPDTAMAETPVAQWAETPEARARPALGAPGGTGRAACDGLDQISCSNRMDCQTFSESRRRPSTT